MKRVIVYLFTLWGWSIFAYSITSECFFTTEQYKQRAYKRPVKVSFWSLTEGSKIPFYGDRSRREVIDSLQNDLLYDNFVEFIVDTCVGDMIYAQPVWSNDGRKVVNEKGWVHLSDSIKIRLQACSKYVIPLYELPSERSRYTLLIEDYIDEPVDVLKTSEKWVCVRLYSQNERRYCEGWLPPYHWCPLNYFDCDFSPDEVKSTVPPKKNMLEIVNELHKKYEPLK